MEWKSAIAFEKSLLACLEACLQQLGNPNPPDLLTIFVSEHYQGEFDSFHLRLRERFPNTELFGCTVAGLIGGGVEEEQKAGLTLTAAWLPDVSLSSYHLEQESLIDPDAPPAQWHQACGGPECSVHLLLSDPYSFEIEPLLSGLDYAYPKALKVGGLASGGAATARNTFFRTQGLQRSGVIGLCMSGKVRAKAVVAQGCRPIGPSMVITNCQQNAILELDQQPAPVALMKLLAELSPEDRKLAKRHLFVGIGSGALRLEYGPGDFLIRNVMGIEPKQQILLIGALVRKGQVLQFHLRDVESSRQDLDLVLHKTLEGEPEFRPVGALLFSCVGRGRYLYGEDNHDSSRFFEAFGQVPLGGFFGNGEIGPVGESTFLHGYTSCFVLFSPDS